MVWAAVATGETAAEVLGARWTESDERFFLFFFFLAMALSKVELEVNDLTKITSRKGAKTPRTAWEGERIERIDRVWCKERPSASLHPLLILFFFAA